jgi:Fic-DOC domain mobile mystery protein B
VTTVIDPIWESDGDGSTPLDPDEAEALIPGHISTRSELNAWEAENIRAAMRWAAARPPNVLDASILRTLHKRMFDKTWRWAGRYRMSDTSVGPYRWSDVPRLVHDLVADVQAQFESSSQSPGALDALAARYHHRLVLIHPFPNGNGRHARLATDLLLQRWGRPRFSWGGAVDGVTGSAVRQAYVSALRDADGGRFEALLRFVRS